ncbi:hypothetical protein OQA88_3864 [Cercophora sp. LCS_1]
MKVSVALLSALAAVGLAKPAITNTVFDVREGVAFTLTWIDAVGPVKVELLTGPNPTALNPIETLATGATGGSFTWTPENIVSGNYAFRVTDSTGENYSTLFAISGTGTATTTSTGSSRSSTATRSSASSGSSASSSAESTTSAASTTTRAPTTTAPTTTRTPASTPTANINGSGAERFSSSLALVFLTAAALVFFN